MRVNIDESRPQRVLPQLTTRVRVSEKDELDVWVRGEGEPIVFVHGAMTRDLLEPLANELASRGRYQVIHYGRRGHGGRGLPGVATDIAGQAADVVTILDALGLDRAHVAGHSLGADIALDMATRTPDRLSSVILFEAMIPRALGEAAQREVKQVAEEAMPSIAAMYRSGEADRAVTAFCDLTAGVEGAFDLIEPVLPRGARELAAVDLDTFLQVDGPAMFSWTLDAATVREIPTPIQWFNSADSAPGFHDSAAFLQELLPATTSVVVAGAGHYFPLLKLVETATAVDDWLRSRITAQ